MLKITDKAKCCGCGACENICPKNCITMTADEEGFLYPVIDFSRCIDCNACVRVCPVLSPLKAANQSPKAFAAAAKDDTLRLSSSSGGVFSLLAKRMLEQGGSVYGAAFDDEFQIRHIGIRDQSELERLRGSKYVQSRTEMSFSEIKRLLSSGTPVLFSGTPCQVAGLKKFLGREYDGLTTVDLICHGVPSPLVWKKYLEYQSVAHQHEEAQRISFRHKKYGWKRYSVSIEYDDTEYLEDLNRDKFMRAFLTNLCLRPSCYECAFKTIDRVSDITIADFWGVEQELPSFDDDKGTSLVIIHSKRGENLIASIQSEVRKHEVELNRAIAHNTAMISSAPMHRKRAAFMQGIADGSDFGVLVDQFCHISLLRKVYRKLKRVAKKILSPTKK